MTVKKQKTKETVNIDDVEYELNEDGLPVGEPIDFTTLQRVLAEQRNAKSNAKEDDAS